MVFRDKAKDGTTRLTGDVLTMDDILTEVFSQVYPVGWIAFTVDPTNPSTMFGGTWVAWGSGRVPVGVNAADTEFNTVEETGGAKTHTLTVAELAAHDHTIAHTHTINHSHSGMTVAGTAIRWLASQFGAGSKNGFQPGAGTDPVIDAHSGSSGGASTPNTGSKGSGDPHNNLQPYITCYMWKRTA